MKRILLTLLAVVLVLGLFAAVGYSGYRLGYAQGAQSSGDGEVPRFGLRPFDDFGPRGSPGRDFEFGREFGREFGGSRTMHFGFLPPLLGLACLAGLALILGLIYWLFTRNGWRVTRPAPVVETPPPPAETEIKE